MILAALLLQAAPALPPPPYPDPPAEAIALGRRLAETGALASLLPMIAAKETDELVAAHATLSAADQAELRRTADATFQAGRAKLMAAQARAYAERLSPADLRTLAARADDAASRAYREVQPAVIVASMAAMAGMDLKRDTLAAFCAKTGKGCAK